MNTYCMSVPLTVQPLSPPLGSRVGIGSRVRIRVRGWGLTTCNLLTTCNWQPVTLTSSSGVDSGLMRSHSRLVEGGGGGGLR